jgi:branched-chain amino acid transport system substrate-binding protein
MIKHSRRTALGVMAGGVVSSVLTSRAAKAAETIKIGIIQSLSGPAAPFGIPQRNVARVMVDRINAEGGIKGYKLELVVHDDQTNPTEAARGATRLIRQEGVKAIIGASTTGNTLALMPIAEQAAVPVLAGVSGVLVTSKANSFFPWVFRTTTTGNSNVAALVKRNVFEANRKRIAIFYQEDAFGKEEAEITANAVKQVPGFEVLEMLSAPPNAIDLTAAATRIRNTGADILLLNISAPAMGGALMRAARQVGLEMPVAATTPLAQKAFIDAAGPAAEGVKLVSLGNWDDPLPKQAELGTIMTSNGLQPSGSGDLFGATSVMLISEALRLAANGTGQAIRDALETICGFQTYMAASACYSAASHDGFGPEALVSIEVKDGRFKTVR